MVMEPDDVPPIFVDDDWWLNTADGMLAEHGHIS